MTTLRRHGWRFEGAMEGSLVAEAREAAVARELRGSSLMPRSPALDLKASWAHVKTQRVPADPRELHRSVLGVSEVSERSVRGSDHQGESAGVVALNAGGWCPAGHRFRDSRCRVIPSGSNRRTLPGGTLAPWTAPWKWSTNRFASVSAMAIDPVKSWCRRLSRSHAALWPEPTARGTL